MELLYPGSFLVRSQVLVVPLPGASDNPRVGFWKHSASGVDKKGCVICREFKSNKKLTGHLVCFLLSPYADNSKQCQG